MQRTPDAASDLLAEAVKNDGDGWGWRIRQDGKTFAASKWPHQSPAHAVKAARKAAERNGWMADPGASSAPTAAGPSPKPKAKRSSMTVEAVAGNARRGAAMMSVSISSPSETAFHEALELVRAIPGRRFSRQQKRWLIPIKSAGDVGRMAAKLREDGWNVETPDGEDAGIAAGETHQPSQNTPTTATGSERETTRPVDSIGVQVDLRPYQKEGAAVIIARRRLLLADEPGLGKTFQALAALEAAGAWPAVVVCPASLRAQWADEASKAITWRKVLNLDRKPSGGRTEEADLTIVGYETLHTRREWLPDRPKAVVLDEMHYCQKWSARRTKEAAALVEDCFKADACGDGGEPIVVGLSGTPMRSGPAGLEPFLSMTGLLSDFKMTSREFLDRYAPYNRQVWTGRRHLRLRGTDPLRIPELHEKLNEGPLLRRRKQDVLHDLPPKSAVLVPVSLDPTMRRLYKQVAMDVADSITDTHLDSLSMLARASTPAFGKGYAADGQDGNRRQDGHGSDTDDDVDICTAPKSDQDRHRRRMAEDEAISAIIRESVDDHIEARIKTMPSEAPTGLAAVTFLRRLAAAAKLPAAAAWVEDWLDAVPGRKLIVWCHHRAAVERLADKLGGEKLYGGMSTADKLAAVEDWSHPKGPRVLVASITAAGVGLNLQAASDAVFVEHPWSPADIGQAEDRIHRIGQNRAVMIHHLAAENTIDETVLKIVLSKSRIIGEAIDGGAGGPDPTHEALHRWLNAAQELDYETSAPDPEVYEPSRLNVLYD